MAMKLSFPWIVIYHKGLYFHLSTMTNKVLVIEYLWIFPIL